MPLLMERRDFFKLGALTGTSAALAGCGHPEHVLIRFIPEEELVPGLAVWKPSVCPLCSAGCGLQVRVMEGEAEVVRHGQVGTIRMGLAKKLEGDPAHPVNRGALCPRGQAAIQVTYHPDRIRHPLKRSGPRGSGEFHAVSWDAALSEVAARLDALAAGGEQQRLVFLTRPRRGRRRELIARFLQRFGARPPLEFDVFEETVLRQANFASFGRAQLPTFDFAGSACVVSFGADFLGTWNSPVSQTIGYGEMRQRRPRGRGKLVQLESRMSLTGANADEWIPIAPGTDGVVALGLAHVIVKEGLRPIDAAGHAGRLIEGWTGGLAEYAPQAVERLTGVAAGRITRLARELVERSPAIAVIGGAPLAHTNGIFHALAVNALNALLGSVDRPGGLSFMPLAEPASVTPAPQPAPGTTSAERRDQQPGHARTRWAIDALAAEILSADAPVSGATGVPSARAASPGSASSEHSPVQVLLIDDVNPVFATPRSWRVREALERVPFIASFGSFIDDTSVWADIILPDHSFLESWIDSAPESGATRPVHRVAPPAMRALHDTRPSPDVLLDLARRLRRPLDPPLPWQTFEEMLRESDGATPGYSAADAAGVVGGPRPAPGVAGDVRAPVAFRPPRFDGDPREYPLLLLPFASHAFLDGSLAHLPWLQELPDPLSTAIWSSWVEINPHTASRLGIAQGDLVDISSRHGSLRAPALLSPAIAPDVVAMPVGQGHEHFTRYASGRGANPLSLLAAMSESETGSLAWAATRVRVARAGPGDGSLILFAGGTRETTDGGRR